MARKRTRREMLEKAAAAGFALPFSGPRTEAQQRSARDEAAPDLILTRANIITMDDRQPRAEAVAVKDDRFLAVGKADDVRNIAGPSTKIIDLEGRTVVPGFIDAHIHVASAGRTNLLTLDAGVNSLAELKRRIAQQAAMTPNPERAPIT